MTCRLRKCGNASGVGLALCLVVACSDRATEPAPPDETGPVVVIVGPPTDSVSGTVTVTATVTDDAGVAGVRFLVDGTALGDELTGPPFEQSWNTLVHTNGRHTLQVLARDREENTTTAERRPFVFNTGSLHVSVTVTGEGADPDGLDVLVDGLARGTVPGTGGALDLDGVGVGTRRVIVGAVSYNCAKSQAVSVEVLADQPTTALLSVECAKALSQAVAFGAPADDSTTAFEVFRINGDGTGLVNLTNAPSDDFLPSWSFGGSRIAFVSDRDDPWWDIYVMNSGGTGVQRLTTDPGWDNAPVWSPNNDRIAFSSDRRRHQEEWGFLEVWVMNADGSGQTRLTTATDSSYDFVGGWKPDGTGLLVERFNWYATGSQWLLVTLDPLSVTVLRASSPATWELDPSYSPDGSRIVHSVISEAGRAEIAVLNADGTGPTLLTDTPNLYEVSPAWTDDGSRIVYVEDAHTGLMIMNSDGSGPLKILSGEVEGPSLAPSGRIYPPLPGPNPVARSSREAGAISKGPLSGAHLFRAAAGSVPRLTPATPRAAPPSRTRSPASGS